MKNLYTLLSAAALVSSCSLVASASAQTIYSNTGPSSILFSSFGAGRSYDASIVGQVFVAPAGSLMSWTFYNDSQASTGSTFGIAAWNGTAGPNLFTATSSIVAPDPDNSPSYYSHTYSGINLALTAGQAYFAYLTTDNIESPVSGVTMELANTSPLGRTLAYSFNTNSPTGAAYNTFTNSLVYSATFGTAAVTAPVPEPASWAMMIVGVGLVGGAMRRRPRQMARVAHG